MKRPSDQTFNWGVWWRRRETIGVFVYCVIWLVLPLNHNNHQLLAYSTTYVTAGNDNATTVIDTHDQGTSGTSNRGARGKESIQQFLK